jgi:hypothetical protein
MQSQKHNQNPGRGKHEHHDPGGPPATDVGARWAAAQERRRFLTAALAHDAVEEAVTEMLFEHVVVGRYHWTVVANSLAPILSEATGVAEEADWAAAADRVLDPEAPATDPEGLRRSEQGTDFGIALIRRFLRALADDPLVRERLLRRPEVGRRGFDPAYRAAVVKEEILDALRSATEEDWNVVAGQLIAEARDVTGPAAKGGAS